MALITEQYDRIYHLHMRKCAGTSVNRSFLKLASNDPEIYENLSKQKKISTPLGKVVCWDRKLINAGDYFFAFSHLAYFNLALKPKTFLFTLFRDPVQRVVSQWRMLRAHLENPEFLPHLSTEAKKATNRFEDYVDSIPTKHLQTQLYTFSERLDIEQAINRTDNVTMVGFVDCYQDFIHTINTTLNLNLNVMHDTKGVSRNITVTQQSKDYVRKKLDKEYEFYNRVREKRLNRSILK